MGKNEECRQANKIKVDLSLKELKILCNLLNGDYYLNGVISGDLVFSQIEVLSKVRDDVIGDELVKNGFNDNDEPNEYGLQLENLIEKLGKSIFELENKGE